MATTFTGNEFANYMSTTLAVDSGNDVALTSTNQDTILGLDGNDTIEAIGGTEVVSDSLVKAGQGNDSIVLRDGTLNSTVQGGAGNDTIVSADLAGTSTNTLFQTLTGENYFEIWDSSESTIEAGSGADTIVIDGIDAEDTFVRGRKGNDLIDINSDFVNGTLRSGDGNDTININGVGTDAFNNSEFQSNFGNNQVTVNDAVNSSFTFGDGFDTLTVNSVGADNDGILVRGRKGADLIDLSNATVTNSTIRGGDGRDQIIFEDISGSEVKSTIGRNTFELVGDGSLAADNDFIGNNTQDFKPTKLAVDGTQDIVDGFFTDNRFTDVETVLVDGIGGGGPSFFGQAAQQAGFNMFESTAAGADIQVQDYTQSVTMTAGPLADNGSIFVGGQANDTLIGGRDDDDLNGFDGADIHTGNAGADDFYGGTTEDSTGGTFAANAIAPGNVFQEGETINQAMDVITDFSGAQGDEASLDGLNYFTEAGLQGITTAIVYGTTAIDNDLFFARGDYNGSNQFVTSASGADALLVNVVAAGNGDSLSSVTNTSTVFEGLGSTLA